MDLYRMELEEKNLMQVLKIKVLFGFVSKSLSLLWELEVSGKDYGFNTLKLSNIFLCLNIIKYSQTGFYSHLY